MVKCLIVSSLDKSQHALSSLLKEVEVDECVCANSSGEARRILNNQKFDLVLINTPLSDEFGHDLSVFIYESTTSGIVMLVKNQLLGEVSDKLNQIGVMCIGKPLDRSIFIQSIKLALVTTKRLNNLQNENVRMHEKVDELKLISRAKFILMDYLNMSESDAHHYIEKKAMDNRISKIAAAKEILKTYE